MYQDYEEIRDRVQGAYKVLRKKGYRCRSNFWCCQTCGWADISTDKDGKPLVGEDEELKAVFWHNQDTSSAKMGGQLYLAWGGDGEEIVAALEEQGLEVEWDGSERTRIKVGLRE